MPIHKTLRTVAGPESTTMHDPGERHCGPERAPITNTDQMPLLTAIEAWAQTRLGRRLSIRLSNSEAGWLVIDMRGALEQAACGGDKGADLTLELKLEGDQKMILYAEQIHDVALHGDSIRIKCSVGNLEIQADSL